MTMTTEGGLECMIEYMIISFIFSVGGVTIGYLLGVSFSILARCFVYFGTAGYVVTYFVMNGNDLVFGNQNEN